jgi:hypothetical protein
MNGSSEVRLLCILVDDNLKVHSASFIVPVSSNEDFGGVIGCVVAFTPSLKAVDRGNFRLYKPPSDCTIRDSPLLYGAQLTRKHLTNRLLVAYRVNEVFQGRDSDSRLDIDVIVHVSYRKQGVFFHLLVGNQAPDSFQLAQKSPRILCFKDTTIDTLYLSHFNCKPPQNSNSPPTPSLMQITSLNYPRRSCRILSINLSESRASSAGLGAT